MPSAIAAAALAALLHAAPGADVPLPPPPKQAPRRLAPADVPLPPPPPGTTQRPAPVPAPASAPPASAPPASAPPTSAPPAPGALPPALRPSPQAAAKAGRPLRVAVPDAKAQGELPPRQLALFEGALLAEVRKLEGVSVIGMGEIRDMLSFEYQRQMLGCASDESCLAEIGGALGVDEILHVSVIVVEKTATLTVKRVDMRSARVAGSDQRRLTRANGEELLSAVGPAVQALFPDRALRAGRTRGVDKELALRLNPPPLPRWVFLATAGGALAATAAGATYGYLASDARSQYRALSSRSLSEPVSGTELKSLEAKVDSRARTANVFLFTGAGLAVAAGVEAFFTDWHGYRAGVAAGPGAAGVQVGGKF